MPKEVGVLFHVREALRPDGALVGVVATALAAAGAPSKTISTEDT
jgi:hypothetical protein